MDTQTMITTLEKAFEQKKESKPTTLAEAASNELMNIMPRISDELFKRRRNANIEMFKEQIECVDKWYMVARKEDKWDKTYLNPLRTCFADIPIFAYAKIPEQKEIIYPKEGNVVYEETWYFDAVDKNGFHAKYGTSTDHYSEGTYFYRTHNENSNYDNERAGIFKIKLSSNWTAPFKLDICVKVPEVPDSVAEITDEAMLTYFNKLSEVKKKNKIKTTLEKPSLGILWAPTDKAIYCKGDVPKIIKLDPALILEIPDGEKSYKHIIATWNIGEEKPYKNWLAEYSEGGK